MTTCALVATCEFNERHFRSLDAAGSFERVIAVDGGFAHLAAIGRSPDLVLGDFDSLGYVPDDVEAIQYPSHKDKSDLEIAFDYAEENAYCQALVYGATGGRLDHTMANLQMATGFAERGMRVTFIAPDCAIRIVVGPERFELPRINRGRVSVFAACDKAYGVSEEGLEYPLDDVELTNRMTWGLSNELIGLPAAVSVEKGALYVFYPLE